ncbi:MAG: nuclear transport factor 2 family protein [Phycisphaerales bacterium]|nr:nuclear transport factor 2 family protein [Phycisphaerales bacterium]
MHQWSVWAMGLAAIGGAAWLALARSGPADDRAAVESVLDRLHDAAARADEDVYFSLYTPDAIFHGTDAAERWTIEQFKGYAMPIFTEREVGWVYTPTSRHVFIAADGQTAWFDETLENAKYGACRGTGVLVRRGDAWLITQYNLTVPIPNDLLEEVAGMIRAHGAE